VLLPSPIEHRLGSSKVSAGRKIFTGLKFKNEGQDF